MALQITVTKLIQSMKISCDTDTSHHEVYEIFEAGCILQSSNDDQDCRFRNRFCKWDWEVSLECFSWTMGQQDIPPPKKWQHSADWWFRSIRFLQGVKRRPCVESCPAYELAFDFWFENRLTPPTLYKRSAGIFVLLVDGIRHVMIELKKLAITVHPNFVSFKPRAASWSSHYFPYGTFQG